MPHAFEMDSFLGLAEPVDTGAVAADRGKTATQVMRGVTAAQGVVATAAGDTAVSAAQSMSVERVIPTTQGVAAAAATAAQGTTATTAATQGDHAIAAVQAVATAATTMQSISAALAVTATPVDTAVMEIHDVLILQLGARASVVATIQPQRLPPVKIPLMNSSMSGVL